MDLNTIHTKNKIKTKFKKSNGTDAIISRYFAKKDSKQVPNCTETSSLISAKYQNESAPPTSSKILKHPMSSILKAGSEQSIQPAIQTNGKRRRKINPKEKIDQNINLVTDSAFDPFDPNKTQTCLELNNSYSESPSERKCSTIMSICDANDDIIVIDDDDDDENDEITNINTFSNEPILNESNPLKAKQEHERLELEQSKMKNRESCKTLDGTQNSRILPELSIENRSDNSNDDDQVTLKKQTNPFAKFSFQPSSNQPDITITASRPKLNKPKKHSQYIPSPQLLLSSSSPSQIEKSNPLKSKSFSKKSSTLLSPTTHIPTKIKDLPLSERQRIRTKWQSFSHPNAPLETKRYQVFVAARLHARAQEPVIRSAMQSLFRYFQSNSLDKHNVEEKETKIMKTSEKSTIDTGFNVYQIANTSPEVLSQVVSSVHFANSKCKQIVESSQYLVQSAKWNGFVPECEDGLKELKGIGPKLADILSYVNTRDAYFKCDYDEGIGA